MSKFSIILQERNTRREVLFTGTKAELEQIIEDLRGSNIHNGLDRGTPRVRRSSC